MTSDAILEDIQSLITTRAVMFPDFHFPLCVYASVAQSKTSNVTFRFTEQILIQLSTFDIEHKFCIDNYYDKINLFKFVFMWLSLKPRQILHLLR